VACDLGAYCVPNLYFDGLGVDVDGLGAEFDADCDVVVLTDSVLGEAEEYA
jgi:hypothetical protein